MNDGAQPENQPSRNLGGLRDQERLPEVAALSAWLRELQLELTQQVEQRRVLAMHLSRQAEARRSIQHDTRLLGDQH